LNRNFLLCWNRNFSFCCDIRAAAVDKSERLAYTPPAEQETSSN